MVANVTSSMLTRIRGRHLFLIDLAVISMAIVGAFMLRFESFRFREEALVYFPAALFPLFVRPPINAAFGLYSRAWAYASVGELARITAAAVTGTVVGIVLFYGILVPLGVPGTVTEGGNFPRSFFPLEGLLTLAGLGASRFIIRASSEWRGLPGANRGAWQGEGTGPVPTLIYGAGAAGAQVLRTIALAEDGLGMRVVGFIDDDPRKRNLVIRGSRVLGSINGLGDIARVTAARRLLIAIPSASGDVVRAAVESATSFGLETRTLPALADLVSGRLATAAIREVRVEDLLRRPPVVIDEGGLRDLVAGKTVLVTGAGGSIGSELARQVFELDPARLVLADRAEGPLYDIERELAMLARRDSGKGSRHGRPRAELADRLVNVANAESMRRLLAAEKPVLVLHAAAYKHVPMMEAHPADAIYTNVGGTLAVLESAAEAGVERFVLVSTDKAVAPASVMGATKRVAEIATGEFAMRYDRPYVAVRFGNVLGSSGSVVPLLQRQLREGVPLTITDPEMTRFFMTIPEASRLILEGALLGQAGDLFILDMGEPVRILDLAHDLARLAGRDPASVPVEYIGLRPGEKLHESLFYADEQTQATRHPKVLRVRTAPPFQRHDVLAIIEELAQVGIRGDHDRARQALFDTLRRLEAARGIKAATA
jgi:FlaA1/EpsC-like NDP-sugar epimerase